MKMIIFHLHGKNLVCLVCTVPNKCFVFFVVTSFYMDIALSHVENTLQLIMSPWICSIYRQSLVYYKLHYCLSLSLATGNPNKLKNHPLILGSQETGHIYKPFHSVLIFSVRGRCQKRSVQCSKLWVCCIELLVAATCHLFIPGYYQLHDVQQKHPKFINGWITESSHCF